MKRYGTLGKAGGLLCLLLVALGFAGAAKGQDAYDMQNAGPIYLLGQNDLIRVVFTANAADEVDIAISEFDSVTPQWVAVTTFNNMVFTDEHFYGGGSGPILFSPSSNDLWELHLGTQGSDSIGYYGADGGVIAIGLGDSDTIQMYGCTVPTLLMGGDGADYIQGGSARDFIYGGYGGGGNPTISFTGYGDNELHGMEGDDVIYADNGGDYVAGHDGDDYLLGGTGIDTIYGNAGHNTGTGSNHIEGRDGRDFLFAGPDGDVIYGDHSDDDQATGDDEIYGGDGDDDIYGGAGKDFIEGGDGNDWIWGDNNMNKDPWASHGNDIGGASDDIWLGGGGGFVFGGLGDDLIIGSTGSYTYIAGEGNDAMFAGTNGTNTMFSTDGDNLMVGMSGSATWWTFFYCEGSGKDFMINLDTHENAHYNFDSKDADVWYDHPSELTWFYNRGAGTDFSTQPPNWYSTNPVTTANAFWNSVLGTGRQ